MATIPPWLNIGPDLFLQAAQAGGQRQEAQASREQQAELADLQRGFMYDELAQRAADAEAQRQLQYENLNNQRYEAAVNANARTAEARMRAQMEDARLRAQAQQQQALRADRLLENQFENDLALQRLKSGQGQFEISSDLRGKELKTRQEAMEADRLKAEREDRQKNDLFNAIREALKGGGRVSDIVPANPEILGIPAGRLLFEQENRPPTQLQLDEWMLFPERDPRKKGQATQEVPAEPQPLPAKKSDLREGVVYQTSRGPARWNGSKFVQ